MWHHILILILHLEKNLVRTIKNGTSRTQKKWNRTLLNLLHWITDAFVYSHETSSYCTVTSFALAVKARFAQCTGEKFEKLICCGDFARLSLKALMGLVSHFGCLFFVCVFGAGISLLNLKPLSYFNLSDTICMVNIENLPWYSCLDLAV